MKVLITVTLQTKAENNIAGEPGRAGWTQHKFGGDVALSLLSPRLILCRLLFQMRLDGFGRGCGCREHRAWPRAKPGPRKGRCEVRKVGDTGDIGAGSRAQCRPGGAKGTGEVPAPRSWQRDERLLLMKQNTVNY